MRYRLTDIGYDNWNDALDRYLLYKKTKPSGEWSDWYQKRVKQQEMLEGLVDKFPNVDIDDILTEEEFEAL